MINPYAYNDPPKEVIAPDCCKDCLFVAYFPDMHPCDRCIRPRQDFYKDYYEKKQ